MKKHKQNDGKIYKLAYKFLLSKKEQGITKEKVKRYFFEADKQRPDKLNGIYLALLKAAQNAQRRSIVIGKSLGEGGVKQLGSVLGDFDPKFVKAKYQSWEQLYDTIKREIKPTSQMNKAPGGLWSGYCRTIIEGAEFLSRFSSAEDFYGFIDPFANCPDERVNLALPMYVHHTIRGFGFALSCEFFRQLNYSQYAKPDVHVATILKGLGCCNDKDGGYEVSLALNRIARKAHVSPYDADKVLWLIGSGKFTKDPEIGHLTGMRAEFIAYAKKHL
jgi:hypothetical protein